jgi:hypothetical protein
MATAPMSTVRRGEPNVALAAHDIETQDHLTNPESRTG